MDDEVTALKERVQTLDKNLTRRLDRLQGTVSFMSKCIEDFNENFASIMDVVRDKRVNDLSKEVKDEVVFPLTSTAQVNAYLEMDPKTVQLIDRYKRMQLRTYITNSPSQPISFKYFPDTLQLARFSLEIYQQVAVLRSI